MLSSITTSFPGIIASLIDLGIIVSRGLILYNLSVASEFSLFAKCKNLSIE
jgi:hypothetical protein